MKLVSKNTLKNALIVAFLAMPSAHALSVSAVGTGNFTSAKTDPATTTVSGTELTQSSGKASLGIGGGALLGISAGTFLELEIGALKIARKYEVKTATASSTDLSTYTQGAVQLPLLLRFNLLPFLSIGAGGFYNLGMGDIKKSSVETASDGTVETSSSKGSFSSFGLKKNDFGALVSLGIYVPVAPKISFIVDGRYALGLSDVNANPGSSTPVVKQKYTDIQVLAGLRISIL
jgi:hypothetical protein